MGVLLATNTKADLEGKLTEGVVLLGGDVHPACLS